MRGAQNVARADLAHAGRAQADARPRPRPQRGGQVFARGRVQPLAVVQRREFGGQRAVGEHHGGGQHGAGQRAAADLVDAGDGAIARASAGGLEREVRHGWQLSRA
jgi:hypothetical protein